MKTIVLIQCVKTKLDHKAKAARLYTSPLFKKSLRYANSLHPDSVYILSAMHGLLRLNDEIETYNETLNDWLVVQRKTWAKKVIQQLARRHNLQKDHFILLAGIRYRQYLLPSLRSFAIPLKGKPFGKQLQWLSRQSLR